MSAKPGFLLALEVQSKPIVIKRGGGGGFKEKNVNFAPIGSAYFSATGTKIKAF